MSKQVALVTGTSSGFGMLISIELAKKGIQVIASMRNPERDTALHQYTQQHQLDSIEVMELDVTNTEQIPQKIEDIISRYGRIDILVNNAGYGTGGLVEALDLEFYRQQFETNFFGLIAVTKAVIPFMREQQYGKIINISSLSGIVGFPALSSYVSSKFAVEGFSECLRYELLPHNIYVTLVEPGPYKTAIWEKDFSDIHYTGDPINEKIARNIAMELEKSAKNAEDPQEVSRLVGRIVDNPRPKLRYLVNRKTKGMLLLRRILPERWIEGSIVKRITRDVSPTASLSQD